MRSLTVHNLDQHPTRDFREFVDLQGDFKEYIHIDRLTARLLAVGIVTFR
jgi:hypothetical protein